MKVSSTMGFLGPAVLAGALAAGTALAGSGTQCSVVTQMPPQSGATFSLLKAGKFLIGPSAKAGDGGSSLLLSLSGVDCPPNNDAGTAGACNSTNDVLTIKTDFGGVQTSVGVLFNTAKGKSTFQASGKNKASAAQIFGPLTSVIAGQSLAVGIMKVHEPSSTPSDCNSVPLDVKPGQKCDDGHTFGVCGFIGGTDPSPGACTSDGQCSATQVCTGGSCKAQTCTMPSDCRSFTGTGGTVSCSDMAPKTCCLIGVGDSHCHF